MAYKNKRIIVRMNDHDYEVIQEKAKELQMSVSEYIRITATQGLGKEKKTK